MLLIASAAIAFGAGGCKKSGAVYHAGVSIQTESDSPGALESQSTQAGDDSADPQEECAGYVHVCGAVNAPGVYPFREGMRLFEAVELAGGFASDADEVWLNQAQTLQDGQRLYIYTRRETKELQSMQHDKTQTSCVSDAPMGQSGMPESEAAQKEASGETLAGEKVNINTADKAELMTLPGIGEVRAEAIMQYRSQCGGFSAVEEIQEISGIKNAVYSKIKDRITV